MATYGVNIRTGVARNGQVPFTGWTGILGTQIGNGPATQGTGGYAYFNGLFQNDDRIAKFFRKPSPAAKQLRSMWFNLTGAAVGVGTSTNTYKRVQGKDITVAGGNQRGGLQTIENVGYVNRATTTADRDAFRELLTRNVFPTTGANNANGRAMSYPVDLSGNGGGNKVTR